MYVCFIRVFMYVVHTRAGVYCGSNEISTSSPQMLHSILDCYRTPTVRITVVVVVASMNRFRSNTREEAAIDGENDL